MLKELYPLSANPMAIFELLEYIVNQVTNNKYTKLQ